MWKVLTDLTNHAGLRSPNQNISFVLEAHFTPGGYSGVPYQEEIPSKDKKLQLVLVSTTKMRKLILEVKLTLAATLYCLYKFRDWIAAAPSIAVRVPIAGA